MNPSTLPTRDPLVARKVKAGAFARAFFPSAEPATDPFTGDHLWIEVQQVQPETGTFGGKVLSEPRSRCGLSRGQAIILPLDRVEEVTPNRPKVQ